MGHVLMASDAIEELALDELRIVPTGVQPLKGDVAVPATHRVAMVRAAFAGLPRVAVDTIEIERSGLSYMVETAEHFARLWPDAELLLLLGADSASMLDRWREPQRLLSLVQLIVLDRLNVTDAPAAEPWRDWPGIRSPLRLATRRIDVSSSEIRTRVASGRPLCGFVPESVAAYIAASGLYLARNAC